MKNNNELFQYTYSAQQQEEIRQIRNKYLPPEEDKMEQLRRLDQRAAQRAQAWAIAVGVIGVLILGTGMSLTMTELFGFSGWTALLVGIPVGVVGIALVTLAYPLYRRVLRTERRRIAPEILRLTDELLK